MTFPRLRSCLLFVAVTALAACSDSTDPAGVEEPQETFATMTVDASEDWSYVTFTESGAQPATVADRSTSTGWHIGFFATRVMLNGGAAGPGEVLGHCLCQNASATDDAVMAMTADDELAAFEGVTAAMIPTDDDAWQSDALAAVIDEWYSYDFQTHTVSAAPENVWKVRTAAGDAYAKFHVTTIEDAGRASAGRVTFAYALQPSAGADFGAVQTVTVDLAQGPVHFDLDTGSEVGEEGDWDLHFSGYDIRVNGGVSGDGQAGASPAGAAFGDVADASDLPGFLYAGDAFGGVFDEHSWYRYNLQGQHQIWPTYDVYLVKQGEAVFKVQLVNYYGETGDSRQITFRYAPLQ
jgi:hypothetical protein